MPDRHPTPDELLDLMAGRIDPVQGQGLALHQLETCASCRKAFLAAFGIGSMTELEDLIRDGETLPLEVRRERLAAEKTLAALEGASFEETRRIRKAIETDPALRTWGMAELLLDRCRELWPEDARTALSRAECAVAILDGRLEEDPQDAETADRAARAWTYVGNCRRIGSDLVGANQAFSLARERLARGTGDMERKAELLDLEASLRRDQRRFREAEAALQDAARIYNELGKPELAARSLMKQAGNLQAAAEPSRALRLVDSALGEIDAERSGRLYAMALSMKTQLHFEVGDRARAIELLPMVADLLHRHGGVLDRLRWRWFEARVLAEEGDGAAEVTLREVYATLLDRRMGYDAALVAMDLALLYLRQGRTGEIQELARGMIPIFMAQEVHREACAALVLFRQAALEEELTRNLLLRVRSFLEDARGRPEASFGEPAGPDLG